MKLQLDPKETDTWVYPLNHPKRDYQYNIARTCFFDNTLVCLPTGLGKTFIAGVVMLNCWSFSSAFERILFTGVQSIGGFLRGRLFLLHPRNPLSHNKSTHVITPVEFQATKLSS